MFYFTWHIIDVVVVVHNKSRLSNPTVDPVLLVASPIHPSGPEFDLSVHLHSQSTFPVLRREDHKLFVVGLVEVRHILQVIIS